MWNERRRHRSERLNDAIRFQLMACLNRYGLPSIVLSDDRGLVVGSGGPLMEMDEAMAAYAPLLCRADVRQERLALVTSLRRYVPRHTQRELSVRRFQIGGERLYLCATGERSNHKELAMAHAITGLQRILRS